MSDEEVGAQSRIAHDIVGAAHAEVKSPMDVGRWKRSRAFHDYMDFLRAVNEQIVGLPTTAVVTQSPCVYRLTEMLDLVKSWTDEFPPENEMEQRFGNKAYRKWYAKLCDNAEQLLSEVLDEGQASYARMLAPYLLDSFGNCTRIDYGSGHEAAFLILLLCLRKLELLTGDDLRAIAVVVFAEYLRVCRHLQRLYKMEPAGSRGVHCLDDFQFVPFLWGSSQLRGTSFLPDHYPDTEKATASQNMSLFLEAIVYIDETKTGPFHEHSNQLWNISAVPAWEKVNQGLFKMYEAEVLSKFPVVQHILFCDLFSMQPV